MIHHKLFLTVIDKAFEGGVFSPEVDEARWKLTAKQDFSKDDKNKYDYSFLKYESTIGKARHSGNSPDAAEDLI